MFGQAYNFIKKIPTTLGRAISSSYQYSKRATAEPAAAEEMAPAPEVFEVPDREVKLTRKDVEALKPVIFGEVSNRPYEKKKLEARVILNTALNRAREYAKNGQSAAIADVLAMPNQYQAYGGKEYTKYLKGQLDELGTKKKQEVDTIIDELLEEIKSGNFQDNTKGAYYYIHNPDNTITYDNKRQLFKTNFGKR